MTIWLLVALAFMADGRIVLDTNTPPFDTQAECRVAEAKAKADLFKQSLTAPYPMIIYGSQCVEIVMNDVPQGTSTTDKRFPKTPTTSS